MLGLARGLGEKAPMAQAPFLRVPAPDALGHRTLLDEFDAPADGPRSLRNRPELGGEPVRRHQRVGVHARYGTLRAAHLEKAGALSIHPDLASGARSFARTV